MPRSCGCGSPEYSSHLLLTNSRRRPPPPPPGILTTDERGGRCVSVPSPIFPWLSMNCRDTSSMSDIPAAARDHQSGHGKDKSGRGRRDFFVTLRPRWLWKTKKQTEYSPRLRANSLDTSDGLAFTAANKDSEVFALTYSEILLARHPRPA